MQETYTTKAIILRREPHREHDTRAVVFSFERGKLNLIARGTRKIESKMAGHLEPVTLARIMVVRGKAYNYIGNAVNERVFKNIKNDLRKINAAGKAIGLFDRLTRENEREEGMFILLESYLAALNDPKVAEEHNDSLYCYFVIKLLSKLGYRPEMQVCLICKMKITQEGNYFNIHRGGLECAKCGNPKSSAVSNDCVKVIRFVLDNPMEKLVRFKINAKINKEIDRLISSLIAYYLNL